MSNEYKAIDFVEMYTRSIPNEPEFEQVDELLRAAAVLTIEADKVIDNTKPGGEDDYEPGEDS